MFRRAFIGYSPSSVKLFLERMEQQHAQLLQESEALLERIENMKQELAEQVGRIRSCVNDAASCPLVPFSGVASGRIPGKSEQFG